MGNDMFNDEQLAHLKDRADEIEALRLALAEATRERDNWTETARTYAKGEDYYRGLIDAALKDDPAAYVADDGSISEDVLRAKLPEMYALAVTERKRAEAEFDRLRQDRYDALNAQTTEGLSAAEWQLRTGKAERERDEARALAVSWEREFNVANHERLRLWDEAESFREKLDQFEANGFPNVASVLDRIAVLSRARETDGAEKLRPFVRHNERCRVWHMGAPPCDCGLATALSALSSPPRPETKDDDKGGAA